AQASAIDFTKTFWLLRYLNDDGSELPEDPNLIRGVHGMARSGSFAAISAQTWDSIHDLPPDWAPPVWDEILLDASAALPKIGTSIFLAATSLEVFIADILNKLASGSDVPADVWN